MHRVARTRVRSSKASLLHGDMYDGSCARCNMHNVTLQEPVPLALHTEPPVSE